MRRGDHEYHGTFLQTIAIFSLNSLDIGCMLTSSSRNPQIFFSLVLSAIVPCPYAKVQAFQKLLSVE
jgi:hypothetical protein